MVNQQNCRSCALENPTEPQERPLHSPKITVWSTFEKVIVIGPYFFEDHNENSVTVNSECYIEMRNNFFVLELGLKSNSIGHVWFQQDGATASTARSSFFTLYWWLPHSQVCWHSLPPPPWFCLCWLFLLQTLVYEHKPRTLDDLKVDTGMNVTRIDRPMRERVEANFQERLQKCINENKHHMRDVVFTTWFCPMPIQYEHTDVNENNSEAKTNDLVNFSKTSVLSVSFCIDINKI